MKRVCVFCGSSPGADPVYARAAARLAAELNARDLGLVYGGASVGLMGVLADAVRAGGGAVTGVIPRALVRREVAHTGIEDLRVVESMHERKAVMAGLADAFVALPGGIGTLEEFFEVWTWAQLGLHAKPVALLDTARYYAHLSAFLDHAVRERFLKGAHRAAVVVDDDPGRLLDRLATFRPPRTDKLLDRDST